MASDSDKLEETQKLIKEAIYSDKRIVDLEHEIAFLKNRIVDLNGIEKDAVILKEEIQFLKGAALTKSQISLYNARFGLFITGISAGTIGATILIIWGMRTVFGL